MKKLMPIGISEFNTLINFKNQNGASYAFVDKSMLINDFYSDGPVVMLITRPRRFGKTLNLSMIQHFFAKEVNGTKTADLFKGLEISKHANIMALQGKFPVIFLTLKELKQDSWDTMLDELRITIRNLFNQYVYLKDSPNLDEYDKNLFSGYFSNSASLSEVDICYSLKRLSELLYKHHKENVIILLDEYDTPMMAGYVNNFYTKVAGLLLGMLGAACKGNVYLRKALITGAAPLARDSLFSDFNNLVVYSLSRALA